MLHGLCHFGTTRFQKFTVNGVELGTLYLQGNLKSLCYGNRRGPLTQVCTDLPLEPVGLFPSKVGISRWLLEILDYGLAGHKNAGVLFLIHGHLPLDVPELAMMEEEMTKTKIDL